MEYMALMVKKLKGGKKLMVAAVIEEPQVTDEENEFVAVVGMLSSVIDNSTNSGSDKYVISPKHFFLNVFVDSTSKSTVHCNALIDDACTTVLIKPEFTNKPKL